MNKIKSLFFSMESAVVLLVSFAIASAVATFIEAVYSTDAAWTYVYRSIWFEAIQVTLSINLAYNLYRYQLFKFKKLPTLLFHLSFLFILLGAGLTRYLGFEGIIHIREHTQNNTVVSSSIYVQLISEEKGKEIREDISPYISTNGRNDFRLKLKIGHDKATLVYKRFLSNGVLRWIDAENGIPLMELVFSDEKNQRSVLLKQGESIEIDDTSFTFDSAPKKENFVNIIIKEKNFYITTNQKISYMKMSDTEKKVLEQNKELLFEPLAIYSLEHLNFSPSMLSTSAVQKVVDLANSDVGNDVLIADLTYQGKTKEVHMFFGEPPRTVNVGGKDFKIAWAPKETTLPFSLFLKDFVLERYPGSHSPSGYLSDVVVRDGNKNVDYKIFMNHILDYQGYRFFQSSYDEDEEGTILSVSKDPGKAPTYFAYLLLCVGMFLSFFNPNSRFRRILNSVNKNEKPEKTNKEEKYKFFPKSVLVLIITTTLWCFETEANALPYIDKGNAKELASLVVQGIDGRMKPFDTASKELLNKIYGGENYKGMNSNQVMLSIMVNPEYWREAPIIKVNNDELKEYLDLPKNVAHAKLGDFYGKDESGRVFYKLENPSNEISRKPPAARTAFDKEIVKIDERINIFYMTIIGDAFKIIPKEDDPNNAWYVPAEAVLSFPKKEAVKVNSVLNAYFSSVINAQENNDWDKANKGLENLKDYQRKTGHKIIPQKLKIETEIIFNRIKIFTQLIYLYLLTGVLLFIMVFTHILKPYHRPSRLFQFLYILIVLAFTMHTIGLGLRWYISAHAPWSNSFESMVYIAWALALSGIIFSRRSILSLSLASILAGITLFTAHLSEMDPQITTIQPVLNSRWLIIHVSVITASYGFLGLCALLGMFTQVMFVLYRYGRNDRIRQNISETTKINEVSMILGLCLLTIGNFLGGVWANESWGRYWGWDSKETWALITILVYAAIAHFRFIPRLNNQYYFSLASMFAYSSVLMTYFGVNYYLTGMHSYAAGESVSIPYGLWAGVIIMILLALTAFFQRKHALPL